MYFILHWPTIDFDIFKLFLHLISLSIMHNNEASTSFQHAPHHSEHDDISDDQQDENLEFSYLHSDQDDNSDQEEENLAFSNFKAGQDDTSDHEEENLDFSYFKSPGGREFWTPKCEQPFTPYVNQFFTTIEQAYNFYLEYGRKSGFEVRKNEQKKDKFRNISHKYIRCSHTGTSDSKSSINSLVDDDSNSKKRRRTASRRCQCDAKLILKNMGPSGYVVLSFIEDHNHPLLSKEGRKFMKCNRKLSFRHKSFMFGAGNVNIGPQRSFSMMKELYGSYENVGATATDFKNYYRDVKARIGKKDADLIIQKFKIKQELSKNSFYFEYNQDKDGHLTGLFWADAIGRRNYSVFGDALAFDATFRTNRYSMVFVPFTGVDNHWCNVTFAAALLEKEDFPNIQWAVKAFDKAMDHVPKCVITDQCAAIRKALEDVWKNVPHRLCMWHIMNKMSSKIGPTLASNKIFMGRLKSVVYADHFTIEEFEEGWKSVMEDYKLQDNAWLKDLYSIRSDWIPAYFNDIAMAGLLRTTSRSESSNSYFQNLHNRRDTLVQFYNRYESAIEKQRYLNSKNNTKSEFIPKPDTPLKIQKDDARLYTRALFNHVSEEIKGAWHFTTIKDMATVDGVRFLKIKDKLMKDHTFEVTVRLIDNHVECECKFFARTGYLCRHSFAALHQCEAVQIPRQFVLPRWTKGVERARDILGATEILKQCANDDRIKHKVSEMWFDFHSCIDCVRHDETKVDKMRAHVKTMKDDVQDSECATQPPINDIDYMYGVHPQESVVIQNPNISRNKGCGSRLKSGKEVAMNAQRDMRRTCSICNAKAGHNARSCPTKK
ncbi:hypothetical protein POM88_035633 [Heracleum sosnowskyi]|uniref:SWIM-type domain-containing protein n=1 Tax=Heracleum sosnowskyi TaxID=360622 RepID=A0AAD8MDG5_9APIA|nr:hypothetical protein POM88_035633 [Heracleum sosnowskyi]